MRERERESACVCVCVWRHSYAETVSRGDRAFTHCYALTATFQRGALCAEERDFGFLPCTGKSRGRWWDGTGA